MNLTLARQIESPISTQGELLDHQTHVAFTLERPGPQFPANYHRIPAGNYGITIYGSPHFGRPMPLLAVPGHEGIEIHWGNYPLNSKGCILVGREQGKDTIWFTREMFDELFPKIQAAVNAEGCWINVLDPPANNSEAVQDAVTGEN